MERLYAKEFKDPEYFKGARVNIASMLLDFLGDKKINSVLEIGCGNGNTGAYLKEKLPHLKYSGVELMSDMADEAKQKIDFAIQGNVEEMIDDENTFIHKEKYDVIMFLDVLEHLFDPWKVAEFFKNRLNEGGIIVGSVPNMGNYLVSQRLIFNNFRYDASGILDQTHLRFFTLNSLEDMIEGAGLDTLHLERHKKRTFIKKILDTLFSLVGIKQLFVWQFYFIATPKK